MPAIMARAVETPHIDRLARQGVQFANGYAGSAVCSTSRAMLLTGRYSTGSGLSSPQRQIVLLHFKTMAKTDAMPRRSISRRPMMRQATNEFLAAPAGGTQLRQRPSHLHIGKWHLGREGVAAAGARV